ncbi:MAG TPA: hypothetical protein VK528_02480 [Flavobacterium sp.]|nr:hypothetical protein [Flavobacterium sp.]
MKTKTVLIVIAIVSIGLSAIGFSLDNAPHKSGIIISIFQIAAMAFLLFLFLSINYFAITFCIRQIQKALRK